MEKPTKAKASYDTNKTIFPIGGVNLNTGNIEHLYYYLQDANTMYVFGDTRTCEHFLALGGNPLMVAHRSVLRGENDSRVNGLFKTIVQNATNVERLY